MAAKQGSTYLPAPSHEAAAAAGDFDPKFEWIDNATNYVLRLNLRGFNKDDFRVQVDGTGRLTVRGQRPAAAGKHAPPPRFHKVFQLPPTANLDDISGRFEASVLTLTVPKCAAAGSPTPTTIEELIRKPNARREDGAKPPPKELDGAEKKEADVVKPKEEINKALDEATRKAQQKEDALKKAMDEATRKAQPKEEDNAKKRKHEQEQRQTTPTPAVRKDEVKPKAPEAAAAPAKEPVPKPEEVAGEKAKAVDRESLAGRGKAVERESLAERVRRRSEEERAKAAAAAAATEEAEREKTACGGWKERVAGERTDMKWADGIVEMATNNKEVIAAAVAAFSLVFFVSHKLFSRK